MAQIIVRNIEDALKIQLQMRAESHGHSMEEEVRQLIKHSLEKQQTSLGAALAGYFKNSGIKKLKLTSLKHENVRNPFE